MIADALKRAEELHTAGDLNATEALCQEILKADSTQPDALHRLGLIATQKGQFDQAIEYLQRALARQPRYPPCHCNLGVVYARLGKSAEAIASFQTAIRQSPRFPEPYHQLAKEFQKLGRWHDVTVCCQRLVQLKPTFAEGFNLLGVALASMGKRDEAVDHYREAIRLQPNLATAYNNLGNELCSMGNVDEAIASIREALRLEPNFPGAHSNLGSALALQGRLDDALASFRAALKCDPGYAHAHSNLLMCLTYHPTVDRAELFAEHCRWDEMHGSKAPPAPHGNHRDPGRRLRVGYVSPDLIMHPVSYFFGQLLTHHNRAQFETYCYASIPGEDAITTLLKQLAHQWRPITGMSNPEIADLVRKDGIDILVDLTGHTADHRLEIFTLKPAPVQVSYLGYPNTTGLKTMDYYLTDAVVDPPGEEKWFTEQLVRLPGGFCCYRPPDDAPPPGLLPADRNGFVTFGSFHGLAKLNSRVLDQWCAILHALPNSRLLIGRHNLTGSVRESLHHFFAERGITDYRLDLRSDAVGGLRHWHVYPEIDIALDSFPWSGHTTACEALWMGVPVVTLRGDRHAGRMVASVLTYLGMTDWIAETPKEYAALAVKMAQNREDLRALRSNLRQRMRASPLCDAPRFTRELEAAYRTMWQAWCKTGS